MGDEVAAAARLGVQLTYEDKTWYGEPDLVDEFIPAAGTRRVNDASSQRACQRKTWRRYELRAAVEDIRVDPAKGDALIGRGLNSSMRAPRNGET